MQKEEGRQRHFCFSLLLCLMASQMTFADDENPLMKLADPETDGNLTVEKAISQRRSLRAYGRKPLSLADVTQLLWAAQGQTHQDGYRAAPSAGALYPLEIFLVAGNVEGLSAGVYHYQPGTHELIQRGTDDVRVNLASAALDQSYVRSAPAVLVITGIYKRTMRKYSERGRRYVHIEVGHAAQNVYLQAEARGLGTVMVGAFNDDRVRSLLELPADHEPLAMMPIGHKQDSNR